MKVSSDGSKLKDVSKKLSGEKGPSGYAEVVSSISLKSSATSNKNLEDEHQVEKLNFSSTATSDAGNSDSLKVLVSLKLFRLLVFFLNKCINIRLLAYD